MKKIVLALMILGLATPAFAGGHSSHSPIIVKKYTTVKKYYSSTTNVTNVTNLTDESSRNEYGAKLDAPNLVRLNKNWTIGTEAGKDFNGASSDEGYFVYGKVIYSGTVLNLSKGD